MNAAKCFWPHLSWMAQGMFSPSISCFFPDNTGTAEIRNELVQRKYSLVWIYIKRSKLLQSVLVAHVCAREILCVDASATESMLTVRSGNVWCPDIAIGSFVGEMENAPASLDFQDVKSNLVLTYQKLLLQIQ